MITAGIDAGLEAVKIVIMKDGEIVGKSKGLSGGAGRAKAIEALYREALADAGLHAGDVEKAVATGAGKDDAAAAATVTEPLADAKAARYYLADATSIVDIGADQTRVVTLGAEGKIKEIALNQKCSAGIGTLLRYTASRFGLGLETLSALPPGAAKDVAVNDGCIVFAELDALELLNRNVPTEQVAAAIVEAMAVRANMVLNDKTVPKKTTTVLIGGVSRNTAFVNALKAGSQIDFVVPEDAEYGGAVGCALIAAA
jgi:benzoyl-CoA reductase subunit D